MKEKTKAIFFITSGLLAFIIFSVLLIRHDNKEIIERTNYVQQVYGNISFKGKIIAIHKIRNGGRTYGIACVVLDSTNVSSFYKFDKWTCFKIAKNIATLPINSIGDETMVSVASLLRSRYVEVNMDGQRKMVFYDSLGKVTTIHDIYYLNNNLGRDDLNVCD